jgi:hypothetical protein
MREYIRDSQLSHSDRKKYNIYSLKGNKTLRIYCTINRIVLIERKEKDAELLLLVDKKSNMYINHILVKK